MKRTVVLLLVGLALTGCSKEPPPPPTLSPADAWTAPPPMEGARPTSTDPFAELPPVEGDRKVGFSSDDTYLGYDDPRVEAAADSPRALRGPFAWSDLVFSTKTTVSSQKGTVTLWFGAHLATESSAESVYPMSIELGPHPLFDAMPASEKARIQGLPIAEQTKARVAWSEQWLLATPELAYANVTHDGAELGVVARTHGASGHEASAVARMPTARFVADVYAERGAKALARGDVKSATTLLEKANAAEPNDGVIATTLARAKTRL